VGHPKLAHALPMPPTHAPPSPTPPTPLAPTPLPSSRAAVSAAALGLTRCRLPLCGGSSPGMRGGAGGCQVEPESAG